MCQCVDPFHLISLANNAINQVRRRPWNEERRVLSKRPLGRPKLDDARPYDHARWTTTPAGRAHPLDERTRWALLEDPEH